VVTHLATHDFPFVRYRTGDIGVLDERPCACGRGLPLLAEVRGRSTDFVVATDGTRMHGLALIYVLREMPEVAAFKIVQETRERVRVLVVPAAGWSAASEAAIRTGLQARLGRAAQIDVQLADRIPAERSGKYRYVVSHVA
jgi:phenylacetate-CoA ligase